MPDSYAQRVESGMLKVKKPIHLWVPGICEGAGGIQAFSRVYVKALKQGFPHKTIRVFSKNDCPPPDDELRALGIKFHSAARFKGPLRTVALALMGFYWGIREKARCSVATHIHFLPVLRLIRWLKGTPYMGILHGIEAWNLRSGYRIAALRAADHLAAVSHFTRQHVIETLAVDATKVTVVPNTFDTERFTPGPKPSKLLERYGLKPEDKILLTVSRISKTERYKGHRQVLAALPTVKKHIPHVKYLIVGGGDDVDGVREAVAARKLEDCVVVAGHVNGSELPDFYRLCDVFVMPSSKEGFGIVFLEAMASGKPVLAGCLDGSVDALDQGRLSPLVDPNDAEDIATKLMEILSGEPKDALWHEPERLRKAVTEQFGYPRVSRLMAEDLARVVNEEPALLDEDTTRGRSLADVPHAPTVVVVCVAPAPEQVDFFNAISATGRCLLDVVYLEEFRSETPDLAPKIGHNHVILSRDPEMQDDVLNRVRVADLVVFNEVESNFVWAAVSLRAETQKAWCVWTNTANLADALVRGRSRNHLHELPATTWLNGRAPEQSGHQPAGSGWPSEWLDFSQVDGVRVFHKLVLEALARWRGRCVVEN
jgi:glycosyltransferase involved in cell wall biosynthesis